MDWSLIGGNLLTPPILFFALGMAATLLRSDLEIPQPLTRALSLYLLFSIGMHGGAELAAAGLSPATLRPMAVGVAASALFPVTTFALLRRRLGAADADSSGGAHDGSLGKLLREAFLNGPVFLLMGALAIGFLSGEKGWESVAPFVYAPFKGVLCLFLLDMGLIAAHRLGALRESGPMLVAFALAAPLVHGAIGLLLAHLLELGPGDALLFTVLFASASCIAVPAAVRVALLARCGGMCLVSDAHWLRH